MASNEGKFDGEQNESFSLDSEYNVDRVYMRATNSKGFSGSSRVAFPPMVLAQIAAIVQNKRTSYTQNSEFIRDAVYHRIAYWLGKGLDDLPDNGAMRLAAVEDEEYTTQQWRHLSELRKKQVSEATADHRKRLYEEVEADLEAVPYYLTDVIEALRRLLP